jgi:membrane-bound lytic murein transglycosylase A
MIRSVYVVRLSFAVLITALAGCQTLERVEAPARAVDWAALPGWQDDRPSQAWGGLLASCSRLSARVAEWRALCDDAALFPGPDDDTARAFFETRFEPYEARAADGGTEGLVTGYYEPLLHGSLAPSARFRYPIYGRPDDLVTVDLGELYPELANKRLRGRLAGRRVVPYYSRAEIEAQGALRAPVLVWADDAVAVFFLQIQGSGRVRLADGKTLHVGYADQNGHPYQAIGRRLIEMGALKSEEVSLQTIRAWLGANPDQARAVLDSNPSYVFFELRDASARAANGGGLSNGAEAKPAGPLGSFGVALTPERAIAVDPAHIALGSPVWLDTRLPAVNGSEGPTYQRLVFAHDTGGAIRGAVRADVFFGFGPQAEHLAGHMKSRGRLFVFRPRARLLSASR